MLKGLPSAGTSQKSEKRLKFSRRGCGGVQEEEEEEDGCGCKKKAKKVKCFQGRQHEMECLKVDTNLRIMSALPRLI